MFGLIAAVAMNPNSTYPNGRPRRTHVFDGGRNLPPAEVERLKRKAIAEGKPVRECACGCGETLYGRRRQTKWATDACRMRVARA